MLFDDSYKTIEGNSEGMYKEKGSKFIAYAINVLSETEVKEQLLQIRKKHYDARHHSYAYVLGFDKSAFRINDDGEPSGTAGRPIYGQILSFDLTNILVVVVRYFGGIKLGVSGLINAYKNASKQALEKASIITLTVDEVYELEFTYNLQNQVKKIIKEEGLKLLSQQFEEKCLWSFSVRKNSSLVAHERLSEIKDLKIKYLYTK
jgi:uncharacterized YigZ family protein